MQEVYSSFSDKKLPDGFQHIQHTLIDDPINGANPWTYLKQVFTALPLATAVEQVEALLPWKIQPGELCCE